MDIREMRRISGTNPLARMLERPETIGNADFDSLDMLARLRVDDTRDYEEREKDIPGLILEVMEKNSSPLTRFVRRGFIEDDAWLVRIGCREGEALLESGKEVLSSSAGDIVPALIEEGSPVHFVKIHVPRIFVRTLSLPMMESAH
ncbi:MAG TPA: hypothetical protein VLD37_06465 [Candidatus Bilamarchaeum sp.]|nr:hypothetical protein [Candidatus Bilamarchaeum sp.]